MKTEFRLVKIFHQYNRKDVPLARAEIGYKLRSQADHFLNLLPDRQGRKCRGLFPLWTFKLNISWSEERCSEVLRSACVGNSS
jgi:hypothetical protein